MGRITFKKWFEHYKPDEETTTILVNGYTEIVEADEICPANSNYYLVGSAIDKLAEYEDAEEQGLLLRLPYNIATCGVVYYVDEKDGEIYHLQADSIRVSKMMISNRFLYEVDNFEFVYEDFGKTVFTTKEEAEQKLASMQKGE